MGGLVRNLIITAIALLLGALLVTVLSYCFLMDWADSPLEIKAEKIAGESAQRFFLLESGETLSTLARALQSRGLLEDRRRLLLFGRVTGLDTRLQAGEYTLEEGATPRELLEKLNRGDVVTHAFRIEEGSNVARLLMRLSADPLLNHVVEATDARTLRAELDMDTPFAEGMFFPDTYRYRRGDSDRDILLRAHDAMLERIRDIWADRAEKLQISDAEQAVILASIIEKETGLEGDRKKISQVFHNRLAKRMLLQTDPTVIYALGSVFDGNLTRAHLQLDSPFNTYRYRDLPPTPIALPSAASLVAAVQPAPGDYLYFVAKGDGSSHFSRTLAEHNAAVRKYQLAGK